MSEFQMQEQERHDNKVSNRLCCAWCEQPIEDDYAYDLGNGEIVCEDCMRDARIFIDD